MRTAIISLILFFLLPVCAVSQAAEVFDYVSPLENGYAAVKKGTQWSFINSNGNLMMDFRDDLVKSKTTQGEYPILSNNRCLIVRKEKGISYFGFIDEKGNTIIKTEFLNASNFEYGMAIAIQLKREVVGYNNVLGKNVVNHRIYEVIIDSNGTIKQRLSGPETVSLDKSFFQSPKIRSKFISKSLVALMNKENKWILTKIPE